MAHFYQHDRTTKSQKHKQPGPKVKVMTLAAKTPSPTRKFRKSAEITILVLITIWSVIFFLIGYSILGF